MKSAVCQEGWKSAENAVEVASIESVFSCTAPSGGPPMFSSVGGVSITRRRIESRLI